MFTEENPEVSHLKICGCLVYIHIPKEKISKLDPSGKKGLFVGYNEKSKAYQIFIQGYRQIELCRDVTFDEDTTFRKSKKDKEDEEEHETPRDVEVSKLVRNEVEEQILKDHDMKEPHKPEEIPSEMISCKRRLNWACEVIEES